jgi:hypothetical protein
MLFFFNRSVVFCFFFCKNQQCHLPVVVVESLDDIDVEGDSTSLGK